MVARPMVTLMPQQRMVARPMLPLMPQPRMVARPMVSLTAVVADLMVAAITTSR